jgi:TolB-like protein
LIAAVLLSLALAAGPNTPKLVVLNLNAAGGVDAPVAVALTESVTAEVAARGFFEVLSSAEVQTMLGAERQRQMLGCSEETSCMTELAGALGAQFVMTGSLTKLGEAFQLNLQAVDTKNGKTLGRTTKLAKDFESIRLQIPYAVAEACGTPLPPPPSRVVPYALLSSGAAAVIGGGVLGMVSLTNESAVAGELAADDKNRSVVLQPADTYRDRLAAAGAQKTISLAALLAGAALIGAGIYLMPADAPQPGIRVALVPTANGFALVGALP